VPDDRDAEVPQILRRKVRKNRFVNLVLAERSLILSKAKAPQPDHDVHDEPHNRERASSAGEARVSRSRRGSRGFAKYVEV
jgi:hypothetical protein